MSDLFVKRIFNADHRYDFPRETTMDLVKAIQLVVKPHVESIGIGVILNLLDVIKIMIHDPTVQQVKLATYLIGEDFEPEDIRAVYWKLANGRTLDQCELIEQHRVALKEILEAKP